MEPQRGDLVLVHTPGSLICWLIRKITGSHWNHVAWALGPDLLIESQGGEGVHLSPSSRYKLDDTFLTKIVRIKDGLVSEPQLTEALLEAQGSAGKKYDWWLIIQLAWLYLWGTRKREDAHDWDNAWICSELVAKPLWKHAKFRFRDDVPVDNITPGDIAASENIEAVRGV